MIGHTIAIHNGREHLPIYITDRMPHLQPSTFARLSVFVSPSASTSPFSPLRYVFPSRLVVCRPLSPFRLASPRRPTSPSRAAPRRLLSRFTVPSPPKVRLSVCQVILEISATAKSCGGARDTSARSSHASTRRIEEAPPPATPPSPQSHGSSDDEASNPTELSPGVFLAPPQIIDGGKKLIYVAHLRHRPSKVPKAISNIVDDYWTGWPPHFGELSPQEQDAYVARFRETYTWQQRTTDEDDVLKHLLSRIRYFYRHKFYLLRKDYKRLYPLTEENPDYSHWLPYPPPTILPDIWKKLIDDWNTEKFKQTSNMARKNAKSVPADQPAQKSHGQKSMMGIYEELSIKKGSLVSIDEFRRHWGGENPEFEEKYKMAVGEKYRGRKIPPFDPHIYADIVGPPKRGRWKMTPPQLLHLNQFMQSERELELAEVRRREKEERQKNKELRRQVQEQNEMMQMLHQSNAAISVMWRELSQRGYLQNAQVPHHLVAGSSSQGPIWTPELPQPNPALQHHPLGDYIPTMPQQQPPRLPSPQQPLRNTFNISTIRGFNNNNTSTDWQSLMISMINSMPHPPPRSNNEDDDDDSSDD